MGPVAARVPAHGVGADRPRPAIVESVDPDRDTLTLLLREPGAEPRLVEVDEASLRAEHAAGQRAAAIRLNFALHSFPAQSATVRGTATLAGHWSQAKQETYVGDTRAIYRHSVHVAREDLGTDGTDEDRINRYAQRISENRQRQASVRQALDRTRQLGVDLPETRPLPLRHATELRARAPCRPRPPRPTLDRSLAIRRGDARAQRPPRKNARLESMLPDPPEPLVRALGPVPEEHIARERWEREARRLEALGSGSCAAQPPASAEPAQPTTQSIPQRQARPAPRSPQRDFPTIRR